MCWFREVHAYVCFVLGLLSRPRYGPAAYHYPDAAMTAFNVNQDYLPALYVRETAASMLPLLGSAQAWVSTTLAPVASCAGSRVCVCSTMVYGDSWIRNATCVSLRAVFVATGHRSFARMCPMFSGLTVPSNLTGAQRINQFIGCVLVPSQCVARGKHCVDLVLLMD